MEPSRCRAFLAAAEHGSFARATEELNYTTSGVSQLVAALEKELGFALFTRKKKGVELNAEGKQMLPSVRAFVQQERSIYQVAAEIRGLSVGEIVIASYFILAKGKNAARCDFLPPKIHTQHRAAASAIRAEAVAFLYVNNRNRPSRMIQMREG